MAVERQNTLYVSFLSLQIVKLLGNALVMMNNHYPVFEKHLYTTLQELGEDEFCAQIDLLLHAIGAEEIKQFTSAMIDSVERRLLEAGFIEKQPKSYWVQLRPKYQVEGCV